MTMNFRRSREALHYHKVISKAKTKSSVWKHFGIPVDENGEKVDDFFVICRKCCSAVSSKGGSTTNLRNHLKVHHPSAYHSLESRKNEVALISLDFSVKEEPSSDTDESQIVVDQANWSNDAEDFPIIHYSESQEFNDLHNSPMDTVPLQIDGKPLDDESSQKCTEAIAKFLVFSMQPYSVVNTQSFKEMVATLNPHYSMPEEKFFSHTLIPNMYADAVEKLKLILSEGNFQGNYFSITCDSWTSVVGNPFVEVTIQFIDASWNLNSACLSCDSFSDDQSAEDLKEYFEIKLIEWDLDINFTFSCTTNSSSNIVSSINLMDISHIPCFGDSINMAVNSAVEVPEIKTAIEHLKALRHAIAHSQQMKQNLKEIQELLNVEVKSLFSSSPIKWWSALKMCKKFLKCHLPICKMLENFPEKKHLMLQDTEITALEEFSEVASILEDICENLSGEDYVASSLILPLVRRIKKRLKPDESNSDLLKNVKEKITNALAVYENGPLKTILEISTFLDPRFKLHFFDEDAKPVVKQTITSELLSLNPSQVGINSDIKPTSSKKKKKRGLSALLEEDYSDSSEHDKTLDEIERYLTVPRIRLTDNPLQWWHRFSATYPKLGILAKKYLSMQGTSLPSEKLFSSAGSIIDKKKYLLTSKHAEMQIFLCYNEKVLNL